MRIGLGFFNHAGFSEANLRGIASFARPNRPWSFDLLGPTPEGIERLIARSPDGLLLGTSDEQVLARVERSGIPAVNTGAPSARQIHQIGNDEELIGQLAAKHFITRGYKRFAYVARTGTHPDARLESFQAYLRTQGYDCSIYTGTHGSNAAIDLVEDDDSLGRWLKALAKPVAVFCMFDDQAWVVAEECLRAGINVPADIAVLGVDDHPAKCLLCDPPLSSIQTAGERIGYEAAALLERVIAAPTLARQVLKVPPVRIVNRRSTDAVAASDRLVAYGMTLMRANLANGFGIEDVCAKLACSRRSLERRFHACTSMTPAQTWARFRVEEAQRLLAETDLTVEAIASLTGLGDGRQVAAALRKATGLTPMKFRRNASL